MVYGLGFRVEGLGTWRPAEEVIIRHLVIG